MKIVLITLIAVFAVTNGHIRLLDPPSRVSLWRFPEFSYLNPEVKANDDEMWCANIRQFESDTRCGICGDPVTDPTPRPTEYKGRFWRDVATRTYTAGQVKRKCSFVIQVIILISLEYSNSC